MKEYIKKIKILYGNKKYRSLVILGLYLIGFTIVVGIMQMNAHKSLNNEELNSFVSLDKMTSYAYKYTLTSDDVTNNFIIEGLRYQNKERITFNNTIYYITDNNLYSVVNNKLHLLNDDLVSLKLLQLNNTKLKALIDKAKKDYSLTNDNIITENYTLSLIKFLQLYDNDALLKEDQNINITITKNQTNMISILFDLTNYYHYKNYQGESYKLLIDYTNVNKITDLQINYEKEESNNVEG